MANDVALGRHCKNRSQMSVLALTGGPALSTMSLNLSENLATFS